jgi:hypothetical protein
MPRKAVLAAPTAFGNQLLEIVGFVIAVACGCVALWVILRAVPEKPEKKRSPQAPADQPLQQWG